MLRPGRGRFQRRLEGYSASLSRLLLTDPLLRRAPATHSSPVACNRPCCFLLLFFSFRFPSPAPLPSRVIIRALSRGFPPFGRGGGKWEKEMKSEKAVFAGSAEHGGGETAGTATIKQARKKHIQRYTERQERFTTSFLCFAACCVTCKPRPCP